MKNKKGQKNLSLLFPKNNEGRTILPWELNRMFRASNAPFRKQKHVLAYYLKKTKENKPKPNQRTHKTPKQTTPPTFIVDTPYKGRMYNLLSVVCGNVWSGQCPTVMFSFRSGREEWDSNRDSVLKAYVDIPWTLMTSEALWCFLYCFYWGCEVSHVVARVARSVRMSRSQI